jgi:predicted nucleotidyltransferase component of viral defense system
VIPKRELIDLRTEWSLDVGVIEKDYVLGWLLAAIASDSDLRESWVFKGGTCLRKCYYETYRLSEDLDFTVRSGGPEEPEQLVAIFAKISEWLREQSGVELIVDDSSFRRRQSRRGNPTTQGSIAYRGPNSPPSLPKVKIDITSDELLADEPTLRPIGHQYSDRPLPGAGVTCYSLVELFAEKLRALAERCRPRDLYDVVHMHRHPDLIGLAPEVKLILDRKCTHAGIDAPTLETLVASPFRAEVEQEWENMLGHQLPKPAPSFADFWATLAEVFGWLANEGIAHPLPRAEQGGDLDRVWVAPQAITSWHFGFPFELIRYAGANRMKVEIDYRAADGRSGPRVVEPYSLRRTKDGNLLLFVVDDRGLLRGYRADRIASVRPTSESFIPRYVVEF